MSTATSLRNIFTLGVALFVLVGFHYMQAWTAPSGTPPNDNVAAPINVGPIAQDKHGTLGVDILAAFDSVNSNLYCDLNGENCFEAPPVSGDRYRGQTSLRVVNSNVVDNNLNVNPTSSYLTLYSPNKDTADYICRTDGRSEFGENYQFGFWGSTYYLNNTGSFGALAQQPEVRITTYDPTVSGSVRTLCSGGPQCSNLKIAFGGNLYCYNMDGAPSFHSMSIPPSNPVYVPYTPPTNNPETSCFTADTKVTVADGSTKEIKDVTIGEQVRGLNGAINTVLGYDRPMLGERKLYSFNDGPYFVTAEHPFLTTEGWKSISVADLMLEDADLAEKLQVTTLEIGDEIMRADGTTEIIKTINSKTAENQMLYNFVLDGNNTYMADGYVTHNKWGED